MTANRHMCVTTLEYITQTIMLIMLAIQLVMGFIALRSAARIQAARFHMAQMLANGQQNRQS